MTSYYYCSAIHCIFLHSSSVFASAGGMAAPFVAQTSSIHPTVPIAVFGVVSVIAGFLMTFLPETKGGFTRPDKIFEENTLDLNQLLSNLPGNGCFRTSFAGQNFVSHFFLFLLKNGAKWSKAKKNKRTQNKLLGDTSCLGLASRALNPRWEQ